MRIAVDAMGGDFAPAEVVLGAVQVGARQDFPHEILLVGDETAIRAVQHEHGLSFPPSVSIHHASERIEMHEHPAQAIGRKRDSSLVVCGQLVQGGVAAATVSMGNTGAALAVAVTIIGLIDGIDRPAIATLLPTLKGYALLLDAGANMDCSPHHLLQFALLGSSYAERALGTVHPTVGLLNVGTEPGKGDKLTKAAYALLKDSPLNFHGNVEGKDVFEHTTDVVVCDGFAGNVLLKAGEGLAELVLTHLRAAAAETETGDALRPAIESLWKRLDYAETGGVPLLGVRGVSFVGHGRSRAKAIVSAIDAAIAAAASGYVSAIQAALPSLADAEANAELPPPEEDA